MAGLGTETLPSAKSTYLPLIGARGTVGVLGLEPAEPGELFDPSRRHLLELFANQLALALERAALTEEAHRARLDAEAERLA